MIHQNTISLSIHILPQANFAIFAYKFLGVCNEVAQTKPKE